LLAHWQDMQDASFALKHAKLDVKPAGLPLTLLLMLPVENLPAWQG